MRDTSARFACCAQLALVSLEIACDGRTRAGLPLTTSASSHGSWGRSGPQLYRGMAETGPAFVFHKNL